MPDYLNQGSVETEKIRDDANAWVARFAPLVLHDNAVEEEDVHNRLELLSELRTEAPDLKRRLVAFGASEDQTLRSTLERAIGQLESIEHDLRKRLARVAPGDPESIPDFEKLNERLDERLARQEIGVATDVPQVLEMRTAPPNWAAAGFLGIFSLGWNAFTAVHATFMIGGMFKTFGWVALALLAFYAIFFAVGIGMLIGAVASASSEHIELHGRYLTVRRKLGSWVREKSYELDPDCQPRIERVSSSRKNDTTTYGVVLVDVEGKPIHLASGATQWQREQVMERLEKYLAAHG